MILIGITTILFVPNILNRIICIKVTNDKIRFTYKTLDGTNETTYIDYSSNDEAKSHYSRLVQYIQSVSITFEN